MENTMPKSASAVRKLTVTAMFAAVSTLLMYIEFPLPFMPPFLKIDLSGVAVLICAFMLGPVQAVLVTLVKDLIHLLSTQTGGVGELADFLILSTYAVTASLVYISRKDKNRALLGCVCATAVMVIAGVLANRFLLIPFYSKIMPLEAIIAACSGANPSIDSINAYYLFGVVPFNLIKGILLSVLTVLLYKRLSRILKKIY